jgi:2-dehydro-3-deoxygluconokinase
MKPVVLIGEPLVGFIADDTGPLCDATRFRGEVVGAEINAAAGLARLGVPTQLIARTGSDELGEIVVRHAMREGIGITHLTRVDLPTGILVRSRRGFGASSVVYRRAGSAASSLGVADIETASATIAGAAWFHVTGVTAALSDSCRAAIAQALTIAGQHGVPTSLDLNYRARLWSVADAAAALAPLVARATLTLAGDAEGRTLTGASTPRQLVAALRRWGANDVVVKRGGAGAYADNDGVVVERPARTVGPAVDEVGAGDAFAAGLIGARVRGLDTATALDWGAVVAAFCISAIGDARGLPSVDEVERALSAGGDETMR